MNLIMKTHTTHGGDIFLPSTIIMKTRTNLNRKRPPKPQRAWLILAFIATVLTIINAVYLLTK